MRDVVIALCGITLLMGCVRKPEPPEKPAPPVAFSDSVPASDPSKPVARAVSKF